MTNPTHTPVALDEREDTTVDDLYAVEAALVVLNETGFDIASPRDGDLDDLEQERFNAVADACRAYLSALGGEAGTLEIVTKQFDEALRRQQELEREITGLRNSYAEERRQRLSAESELARLKAQPGAVKALKAIAEGYPVRGEHDRYVVVENPDFRPDDGSDPNICVDTFALAAPVSQEPVAWLIGGETYTRDRAKADDCRARGFMVEPLYASPQPSEGEPSDAEVERASAAIWNKFLFFIDSMTSGAVTRPPDLTDADNIARAVLLAAKAGEDGRHG